YKEKSGEHKSHEHQHLEKGEQLQVAIDDGPGIKKHGLDIEQDEHDGHQVEFHAEPLARVSGGNDAAFIRAVLHAVPDFLAQQHGGRQQSAGDGDRDYDLYDDRKIDLRVRCRHDVSS